MSAPAPSRLDSLPAGEFKAKCLDLMDQVQEKHMELTITKHGKPVAKLVPCEASVPPLFGMLKGTVTYHGDIVGSTGEVWNADQD